MNFEVGNLQKKNKIRTLKWKLIILHRREKEFKLICFKMEVKLPKRRKNTCLEEERGQKIKSIRFKAKESKQILMWCMHKVFDVQITASYSITSHINEPNMYPYEIFEFWFMFICLYNI